MWPFWYSSSISLTLDKTEKSRMLNEYYSKLVDQYFGAGKKFFVCLEIVWKICSGVWFMCFCYLIWCCFLSSGKNNSGSCVIDAGISRAVKDSTKLSMTKKVNGGKVEPSITAEKGSGFNEKRKTTNVWKKYVYFQQQTCTFSLEKANIYEFGKIMAYRYPSEWLWLKLLLLEAWFWKCR